MTLKKAKKVGKRSWSLDKFSKAVKNRCKKLGVQFSATKVKTCYDGNVTVSDTVSVLRGS